MTATGKKLILCIENDPDTENPCTSSDGQWKFYSFSTKHINFKDPYDFFTRSDEKVKYKLAQPVDGKLPPSRGNPTPRNAALRDKMDQGLAFVLSYYEHGQSSWMMAGSPEWDMTPDKQWDGTRVAGIAIWEEPASNMGAKTYAERYQDCKNQVDEYTEWCNGNCYRFTITDTSLPEEEQDEPVEQGDFLIGDKTLMDEIRMTVKAMIENDAEITKILVTGEANWLVDHHKIVPDGCNVKVVKGRKVNRTEWLDDDED